MATLTRIESAKRAAADLGTRLAMVRELRKLSLAQVQQRTGGGIDASTLSRIEGGSRQNPAATTLQMLCVAYDCDIQFRRDGTIKISGTRLKQLQEEWDAALAREGAKT